MVGIISRQDLLKVRVRNTNAEKVRTRGDQVNRWNCAAGFASARP